MRTAITVFLILVCAFFTSTLTSCHYVKQGEKAFYYDVSSGKAVNSADNPLLPMGFNSAWGINKRFFSVLGTIMDYEFTRAGTGSSPYDETLRWNSSEGVVMAVEYKLYGRVSDPWEFFLHFGEQEYAYQTSPHKDIKVYEAMRQTGRVLDQYLNELAASTDAETIRTRPDWLKQELLPKVRDYMKQFGFEVTDLMFMGNFQYPDGNVITEARQQLTALDSEIRSATQMCSNKFNQVKIDVSNERIEASTKIAEAQRQASTTLAESQALANALKQSIAQIGIDGTMRLKMAELYGELAKAGAVPTVIVTEDSIFASPFYPTTPTGATNARPALPMVKPERTGQ
ncbi:exported hypothetical protein [Verrucomicrobia bacterium]|nr:exported hypothetical protein [Verrucomicrobiota bacterium]